MDSKQTPCTENTRNRGAEVTEHFCLSFPHQLLTLDMPLQKSVCVCVCVCAVIAVSDLITAKQLQGLKRWNPPGFPSRCVFACVSLTCHKTKTHVLFQSLCLLSHSCPSILVSITFLCKVNVNVNLFYVCALFKQYILCAYCIFCIQIIIHKYIQINASCCSFLELSCGHTVYARSLNRDFAMLCVFIFLDSF